MLVGTKDGGFITEALNICDGCNHRPANEHECAGEIGSIISSRFPSRTCECPDCKDQENQGGGVE